MNPVRRVQRFCVETGGAKLKPSRPLRIFLATFAVKVFFCNHRETQKTLTTKPAKKIREDRKENPS